MEKNDGKGKKKERKDRLEKSGKGKRKKGKKEIRVIETN